MMRRLAIVCLLSLLVGCPGRAERDRPAVEPAPVVISIIGTNDLHGHVDRLPILAGYVDNLRAAREPGAVLLLDAGDMWQGTLESNLGEGAVVVAAYNAMGYTAAVIGNHEFDYGPVGPAAVPTEPGDDPRGALRARAAEAEFPLLAANIVDADDGRLVDWPNTRPSVLVDAAGVPVGVIGVTTEATPYTTMTANFAGLAMVPLHEAIEREAEALRAGGARVVVAVAHAGTRCVRFDDPNDLEACDLDAEIVQVVRRLPPGTVDVIVAGHTHAGVAHRIEGVAIIESYSYGRAFGRVDLTVDRARGQVTDVRIFPPRDLCPGERRVPVEECEPGTYEGRPVTPSARVAAAVAPAIEAAGVLRERSLGVTLAAPVRRAYAAESALGNLFADLMLVARPDADVALTNGGGLRADLPAGELTYGELYEASPFDNRFATVRLTGGQLATLVAANLRGSSGFFSLSGVRAEARCEDGELLVALARDDGARIGPEEPLVLVTSDFLASGGDGAFGRLGLGDGAIATGEGEVIREAMAEILRERGGTLDPAALHRADHPRIRYPGTRPVRCEGTESTNQLIRSSE
jgi:2',3'-cyclic-nucleotide 2'-phosphodiesterase (5'-nucleotidase family)